MSASFNHRVIKLMGAPEPQPDGQLQHFWHNACGVSSCHGRQDFICAYDYVTGRQGRTTTRLQYCCEEHAKKFCLKHNLDIDMLPPIPWEMKHRPTRALEELSEESAQSASE